ncbi:MAG: Gfo/Idh/MocA family oxidoreductase [Pseudomonadota bacterium]
MTKLRVGVIGLGYFSQFHLAAWHALPETALVAACDMSPERRADVATRYDIDVFADAEQMLASGPFDIIDIVTPPPSHSVLIRASMAPERVVICQKPFCVDLSEAERMTDEAEAARCPVVIHENFRFQPWYRAAKGFLAQNDIGQIYNARFALRPGDGRGPDAYLSRQPSFQSMERFLIHETAVHFIDLFRYFLGPVTEVYADLRQLNPAIAGEDAGVMMLSHRSGAQSIFDGNRLSDHETDAPRRTMGEFELEGEAGALRLDGYGTLRFRGFGAETWQPIEIKEPVDPDQFGGGCVAALCRHVAQAKIAGTAFENTARDYLEVLRIEDAAYLSDHEARRVSLIP